MNFYEIDLVTIDGKPEKMDLYRGKTLLIVNVASHCGFTPQYRGLQKLYDKFKHRVSSCSGFPVISSDIRSQARNQKSHNSVARTLASPSRCLPRLT